jgi:hypothetical protein
MLNKITLNKLPIGNSLIIDSTKRDYIPYFAAQFYEDYFIPSNVFYTTFINTDYYWNAPKLLRDYIKDTDPVSYINSVEQQLYKDVKIKCNFFSRHITSIAKKNITQYYNKYLNEIQSYSIFSSENILYIISFINGTIVFSPENSLNDYKLGLSFVVKSSELKDFKLALGCDKPIEDYLELWVDYDVCRLDKNLIKFLEKKLKPYCWDNDIPIIKKHNFKHELFLTLQTPDTLEGIKIFKTNLINKFKECYQPKITEPVIIQAIP